LPLLCSIGVVVDPGITDIEILLALAISLAPLLSVVCRMAMAVRVEPPEIVVVLTARRYHWHYTILGPNGLGSGPHKEIVSLGRGDFLGPDSVDLRLVLPRNRSIRFVAMGEGVRCHWKIPALGICILASPTPFGGVIREGRHQIPNGTFCATPSSHARYPSPHDLRMRMPIVVQGVSQQVFNSWYRSPPGNPD
jgi:hypothetical protein